MYYHTYFIKIENNKSRINVKILEENKGKNGNTEKEETAVNAKGPHIDSKYLELLYKFHIY